MCHIFNKYFLDYALIKNNIINSILYMMIIKLTLKLCYNNSFKNITLIAKCLKKWKSKITYSYRKTTKKVKIYIKNCFRVWDPTILSKMFWKNLFGIIFGSQTLKQSLYIW